MYNSISLGYRCLVSVRVEDDESYSKYLRCLNEARDKASPLKSVWTNSCCSSLSLAYRLTVLSVAQLELEAIERVDMTG